MRVIILINQNLNKTLYKNWELEYKKKIDFEFWCLFPLTNKNCLKYILIKNTELSHTRDLYILKVINTFLKKN